MVLISILSRRSLQRQERLCFPRSSSMNLRPFLIRFIERHALRLITKSAFFCLPLSSNIRTGTRRSVLKNWLRFLMRREALRANLSLCARLFFRASSSNIAFVHPIRRIRSCILPVKKGLSSMLMLTKRGNI